MYKKKHSRKLLNNNFSKVFEDEILDNKYTSYY